MLTFNYILLSGSKYFSYFLVSVLIIVIWSFNHSPYKIIEKTKQTWCPCNYQSDMGIVKLWASWMWSCVYSGGWYTCDVWKESSYWGWKSGFIFYRLMVYLTMIPVADADIFDRKCRLESSLTKSWSAIKIGVPARVLLSDHIWLKIQLSQMN